MIMELLRGLNEGTKFRTETLTFGTEVLYLRGTEALNLEPRQV